MFNKNDCPTVRLVTEIINTAADSISDVKVFLEFCAGILLFNKKIKNCNPPYSQYGEVLQLKGKIHQSHMSIAKSIVKYVKLQPRFTNLSAAQDRILFCLSYCHTTTIAMNTFSEESVISEGGILTQFWIHDVISRLNHSCAPNLHHCLDDANMTNFVAVRPIKKGDQIFIDYVVDMKFPCDYDRRKYLQEVWGFDCRCEKCLLKFLWSDENHESDPSYQYIEQNFDALSSNNTKEVQTECIQFLNKYGHSWSTAVEFVTNCLIHFINKS